jgi:hypothetical protein
MRFEPLSPSPFPRTQGKGSRLSLPACGEGPQGGVNAQQKETHFYPLHGAAKAHDAPYPGASVRS